MILDVMEPIIQVFEKRSPGVKIDLLYSARVELEQWIFADTRPGTSGPSPSEINALDVDFGWMARHGSDLREHFATIY